MITQAVPGPGHYDIKSQFEKKSEEEEPDTEHASVPFGSTLEVSRRAMLNQII